MCRRTWSTFMHRPYRMIYANFTHDHANSMHSPGTVNSPWRSVLHSRINDRYFSSRNCEMLAKKDTGYQTGSELPREREREKKRENGKETMSGMQRDTRMEEQDRRTESGLPRDVVYAFILRRIRTCEIWPTTSHNQQSLKQWSPFAAVPDCVLAAAECNGMRAAT